MFSFQSAFVSFIYLKQPIYYITVFWICQVLFSEIFVIFLSHLQKHLLFYPINSYWFPLLFRTTCLLYHISFILSSTFSTFFKIFLWLSLSSGDLFIIAYPDAFCQYGNSHNDKLTHHNNFVISVIQILKI